MIHSWVDRKFGAVLIVQFLAKSSISYLNTKGGVYHSDLQWGYHSQGSSHTSQMCMVTPGL